MREERFVAEALLLASLLGLALLAPIAPILGEAAAYVPRPPIVVDGNGAFVGNNGVTGGAGTASDPFVIEGWDIDASAASGITIRNTDAPFVIRSLTVHGIENYSMNGIELSGVANGRVENVTVSNVWFGIVSDRSANITLARNNISSNAADGIVVYLSSRVTVAHNNVSFNAQEGIRVDGSSYTVFSGNRVDSNGGDGIEVDGADRVVATDNQASNNGDGISFAGVTNGTAVGNTVLNGAYGIRLWQSRGVVLGSNNLSSNGEGIRVGGSTNVTLTRNYVSLNTYNGVQFVGSSDSIIKENDITSNGDGPSVYGAGIRLDSSARILVYNNNLLGNAVQAVDDGGSGNLWDGGYPAGGNRWSDYSGPDLCSGLGQDVCPNPDGVGDVAYIVDSDTRDRYPLMGLYVPTNAPPTATFDLFPSSAIVTTVFTADASASWDLEDAAEMLQVRWDWEDDGTWDTAWSTTRVAHHPYSVPGSYVVRMEVRDTGGLTNSTMREVEVLPGPVEPPRPLDLLTLGLLALAPLVAAAIIVYLSARRRRRSPR